jgi:hypothetical protein
LLLFVTLQCSPLISYFSSLSLPRVDFNFLKQSHHPLSLTMLCSLAAVISLLALIDAAAVKAGRGYLALDLEKRIPGPNGELIRRDDPSGSFNAPLTQNTNKLEYLINITIGTPPQVGNIPGAVKALLLIQPFTANGSHARHRL